MASNGPSVSTKELSSNTTDNVLTQILSEVKSLRQEYEVISRKVERIDSIHSALFYTGDCGSSLPRRMMSEYPGSPSSVSFDLSYSHSKSPTASPVLHSKETSTTAQEHTLTKTETSPPQRLRKISQSSQYPYRVILTTYPGQVGIHPINLNWGHPDPKHRGPIVVSRHPDTIRVRNSIGAHGGSYCIYHALSIAIGALPATHRPDLEHTEPPLKIGPYPSWSDPTKIVSMDPWGHEVLKWFHPYLDSGIDLRPSIAITKAHMRIPEIEEAVKLGRLSVDGHVILNKTGEMKVIKAAVEPVWYLPGVAARFGVEEAVLRRAIFEDTGGMYPELITRPDLKVFLPPIGGLTVYIFGQLENISNPEKELTVRVHDECNGSDVFGSDICTCRPYLMYGIEKSVSTAQSGGSGLIVYFRKEGRALGEVTKYLVYNSRKRSGDLASAYFQKTESVAGVKDARFQALMPDILHWLGIQKIDHMMSMSNMKYDAIVESGIEIRERCPIPDSLIPPDSRVEIDAKIAAGYFTTGIVPDLAALDAAKGRTWEWDEIHH